MIYLLQGYKWQEIIQEYLENKFDNINVIIFIFYDKIGNIFYVIILLFKCDIGREIIILEIIYIIKKKINYEIILVYLNFNYK